MSRTSSDSEKSDKDRKKKKDKKKKHKKDKKKDKKDKKSSHTKPDKPSIHTTKLKPQKTREQIQFNKDVREMFHKFAANIEFDRTAYQPKSDDFGP